MRVYHHPRDLLCAHSACGCPEQPSPAFTFMFGRCQNRNLPTGYKDKAVIAVNTGAHVLVVIWGCAQNNMELVRCV